MEVNIVELVVQAGALGLTALLLFGLWKYGGGFVSRLMDNLDAQAENNAQSIRVQEQVAASLSELSERIASGGRTAGDTADRAAANRDEIIKTQEQVAGVLTDLSRKLQAHETRAQRRHEQSLEHSADRHAELIGVLKHMNGTA